MRSPSSWQATAATLAQVIEHLVMREVTAQKRAQEERAYHGTLLENMHDAVLGTDDRFVLTEWNRGAEEMFGWTAEEALGQVVSDLVPPGYSGEQLDQDLRELTETGRWRGERTWRAKDGSPILAEGLTVALRGSQGDTRGYLCIMRDMRERTRAETQARERIGKVLESSTDGFYAMDLDWRLTYANGHAVQDASRLARTKLSRGDLLGRTLWEILPGLVGSTMEERFRSAVRDQASVNPNTGVRTLLVDDHTVSRQAIASAFEAENDLEIAGQAGSRAEARGMLTGVDVVILDLGLPDGSGGDVIDDLHAANRRAQALVLSATLDPADLARAVDCRARGLLSKTAPRGDVVNSVRRLWRGKMLLSIEEITELVQSARTTRQRERADRAAIGELTPREKEVLQGVADGLDSRAIADRLHISIRTERNHISNILAKLGVHSQVQALVFALRHGAVSITPMSIEG